jgi:hypothetical protein
MLCGFLLLQPGALNAISSARPLLCSQTRRPRSTVTHTSSSTNPARATASARRSPSPHLQQPLLLRDPAMPAPACSPRDLHESSCRWVAEISDSRRAPVTEEVARHRCRHVKTLPPQAILVGAVAASSVGVRGASPHTIEARR